MDKDITEVDKVVAWKNSKASLNILLDTYYVPNDIGAYNKYVKLAGIVSKFFSEFEEESKDETEGV